jgi:hypothetical protein
MCICHSRVWRRSKAPDHGDTGEAVRVRQETKAGFAGIESLFTVVPALVAGIHVFLAVLQPSKAWMAGTSPAMTTESD